MTEIVGIKFKKSRKVYYFDPCGNKFKTGDFAIVETSRGIEMGEINFEYPSALAEIVLIILAVKFDTAFLSTSADGSEETLKGLISLLEKGTGIPHGSLNYLALLDSE